MRMRVKKWARPELAVCPFYAANPQSLKGKWGSAFAEKKPLHIELGCGKGVSTCVMALENPDVNYVAIDLITTVLGVAKRNAESVFEGKREVDNLMLTNFEIESIDNYFSDADRVSRIYISFPNPWDQRHKQAKHRLTHTRQLMKYRQFLTENGEIWFKTDDDELFNSSLGYFEESGFEIVYKTYDLHASGFAPNYETEHEKMFSARGIPIKALIAKKKELTMYQLERFTEAQERNYKLALAEMRAGEKQSHWIWYIFPQLRGLGMSYNSTFYGIADMDEAKAYLAHPVLGKRLNEICSVLLELECCDPFKVMGGSIDADKLRSSMTLFMRASDTDDNVYKQVLDKFFAGKPDEQTLSMLA